MSKAKSKKKDSKVAENGEPQVLYAVFRKGNRTLVIEDPTPKKLRRCLKRKWKQHGTYYDADKFRDCLMTIFGE